MIKNLSLKTKTFVLLVFLVALTTGPLIAYYLKTASALSELGTDTSIEQGLLKSIELSGEGAAKEDAAVALKKYRQIKVLKERIVTQVLMFSIIYSVAVIFVALAIGYIFISRITRPLKKLTEATQHITLDHLDYQLDEDAGSELGQLERSFNKMSGDLSLARSQLVIAERRNTWQRVARTIAHEIKNPLTPIKLSTERLYEKFLNNSRDFPEVIKSTTQTILSEIGNMQKLVDTFHKYAKFPDPVLRPENLAAIIREVAALYESETVRISCELDPSLPELACDRGQIKEALGNLLKNSTEAIGAAGRPGQVRIAARRAGADISLSVDDNGCGISEENQRKLFQPYFTTKTHGNGIGLALTERIISLAGGKISFTSQEGKGTRFTIIFTGPAGAPAAANTGA